MQKIHNSRLRQLNKQQKLKMLPVFIENPNLLVGKFIQHKVKEQDEDESFWCRGEIIGIDKLNNNAKRSTFNIRYDMEPDNALILASCRKKGPR